MGARHWASFGLLAAAAVAAPCWAGEGPAEGASEDAPRYRLIGKNETLWGIALETTPPGQISVHRYMLALERMNPGAFLNGDIDRLMAGYRLRLPNEAEALALTAEAEPPPALSEPEASPDAVQEEDAAREDAEIAAAEPEAVPEDAPASAEPGLEAEPIATSDAGLPEKGPDAASEDALSGAEPGLEAEPIAASEAGLPEPGLDAVPEDALSGAEPGLEAEPIAASEAGLPEPGLDAAPEDALAGAGPGLEAEPIAASEAGLSDTGPEAASEDALSGVESGLEAESAASGAEPAETGLDAVPEDALAAADLLERLPDAADQDAERASVEPAAVQEGEVAETESEVAPGGGIARPGAAPVLQEPQISPVIELLADLRTLWARDPSAVRTIAITAAMAIVVLFFVLRRRWAGAPKPSRAVSSGPRAGRSFAPPAASDIGQTFPEELGPASGLALQFPEEPDPTGLKLQLAEAYLGLGDAQGAEDLLQEVLAEGDAEQCRQAETLAERLA